MSGPRIQSEAQTQHNLDLTRPSGSRATRTKGTLATTATRISRKVQIMRPID